MKTIHLLLFFTLTVQLLSADFPSVLGSWHAVSETKDPEEIGFYSNERYAFREDGTFYSDGVIFILQNEYNIKLLTVSGTESGNWEIKGEKLYLFTQEWSIDFFDSLLPEFDRATYTEELESLIGEPTIYALVSGERNELVLRDEDDDSLFKMSRIRTDQLTSGTGLPFMEPVVTISIEEQGEDPTVKSEQTHRHDYQGERIRRTSKLLLDDYGFRFSDNLPTSSNRKYVEGTMRPTDEIIGRLLCLFTVSNWVVFSEEHTPEKALDLFIDHYDLSQHLTEEEKLILSLEREVAKERYFDSIGWRIENMWALSWVLGFDLLPNVKNGQANDEIIGPIFEFLSSANAGRDVFMQSVKVRTPVEVIQLEDIFYCAHNAVRSAQLGKKQTVPDGFHPVIDGGTTHERRHALTWVLSPDVTWAETDLST